MMNKNKIIRIGLITTFIVIVLAISYVMSYYPYPDSLLLKISYWAIIISVLFNSWAVYMITKYN